MPPDIADKRRAFAALHQSGCFVIPNPWDAGSARYLQSLGFQALATTSAGFAWSHARPDNGITRDMALAHLHEMVAAVDVPINADFENGFAPDAAGVAENVRLAVATGVSVRVPVQRRCSPSSTGWRSGGHETRTTIRLRVTSAIPPGTDCQQSEVQYSQSRTSAASSQAAMRRLSSSSKASSRPSSAARARSSMKGPTT